jgi:microcystin-dependent protein
MASPYLGEIRCFGFNFAPFGWAFCNGQLLSIAENSALFTILGTTYGGDGTTTFGLPNLQGQIPMHWGNGPSGFNTVIGEVQGQPTVTLTTQQIPTHTHTIIAMEVPSGGAPERTAVAANNTYLGPSQPPNGVYQTAPTTFTAQFSPKAISIQGGSQPHDNMQPYLVLNFCIAVDGIFPARN